MSEIALFGEQARRLNLGCSDDHREGYLNVDQAPPAEVIADLRRPWPWQDSTIEEIYAHDVFEHLDNIRWPGNKGKIWAMNEAWRVLRPGGILDLAVPCVSLANGGFNAAAFADPTHVSFWTADDRYYFCEEWNNPQGERGRLGGAYGIKAVFREIKWQVRDYGSEGGRRSKIFARLEAVK